MAKRQLFKWADKDGMIEIEFDELIENKPLVILIKIGDKTYWLPKSQIDFREWSNIVEVPEWLAIQKELV